MIRIRLVLDSIFRWAGLGIMVFCLIALPAMPARSGTIPAQAEQFKRQLTRAVQAEFGLSGPVALHAAQIHQESGWRADVDSPVGAQGMAQFMPATSAWLADIYPDLGAATPYSPAWAMQAMVRYNRWHFDRIRAADQCNRWAFALSAYNGGLGWVRRDQGLAQAAGACSATWFDSVELFTARADWAEAENRHYVRRIIFDLEPRYLRSGWAGGATCP